MESCHDHTYHSKECEFLIYTITDAGVIICAVYPETRHLERANRVSKKVEKVRKV